MSYTSTLSGGQSLTTADSPQQLRRAGCGRTKDQVGSCVSLGVVMTGKLCVSLVGEAVIPQWRKQYKGRAQ